MRLLLVEDDAVLADALESMLTDEGYAVDRCVTLAAGHQALETADYEIAVVDVTLPDGSGLDLLSALRARGSSTPVLILTARGGVSERVQGLDGGADDYMAKPAAFDEILARLRALRRRRLSAGVAYHHGSIRFEPTTRRVTRDGVPVTLPRREIAILELFLENPGRVLSREYIHSQLYDWQDDVQSNTIEVYVHNLRRLLGQDLLRTVRGVGYVLDPPADGS